MIAVQNTLVSDDLADKYFVCDLQKCKGACCVQGDIGAPLEESELAELEKAFPLFKDELSPEGLEAIAEQGLYVLDEQGDWSTPLVSEGGRCAYTVFDEKGTALCGIERAFLAGKISFRKPISCYLYPVRITVYSGYEAVNYDKWDICSAACSLGKELGVELYKFLKEPLIQKYGAAWYQELVEKIEGVK
jgi:hypothetical protein